MPDAVPAATSELLRECRVFTRYLAATAATDYMVQCYVRSHARIPCREAATVTPADRMLLRVARAGALPARVADCYARFFRPNGALRQKLVLMLAILESSPETHARLNSAAVGGPVRQGLGLVVAGCAATAALGTGLLLLGPVHLLVRAGGAKTAPP